jgi:hypothetical protein
MTPERKEALLDEAAQRAREILAEQLDAAGERPLTVDEIEDLVEEASRAAARWLEERLITEQTPPAANTAACPECGLPARYKQTLHTQLHTIHGEQPVVRRYYYCPPCGHGFCPADAVLGLERGRKATRRRRAWMARLAVQEESFAAVPPLLLELRGLATSASTVERTTVEVGLALAAPAGAAPAGAAPAGAVPSPARLYLAMDGTMCPLRDEWRRDGSLGRLVCRYGEAKVGMAFTTGQKEGLDTGIVSRGCLGTLGDITVFTPRMVALGGQFGAQHAQELVVLGDGAAWIWNLSEEHFTGAEQVLDVYHATEYLADLARAGFGANAEAVEAWTHRAQLALLADGWAGVCEFVHGGKAEASDPPALEAAFPRVANYLSGHQGRMMYAARLRRGASIGSGMIEGAIKQLVGRRIKQTGARWKTEHIGPMVELISLGHTEDWDVYWSAA